MNLITVLLLAAAVILIFFFLVTYVCFRLVFYVPNRKSVDCDRIDLPKGKVYEQYYDVMTQWIREARRMKWENVSIISHDGLKLTGRFYEYAPGAPIELMFHGYRGGAERDMSGGVQRCFCVGRSALVVEQRCSNTSEGNVITFGIREHLDCLDWVNFVIEHYGQDVKIILTGISMGASTVLMAAGKDLPENVIGVLADCGYTSAKEIMHHVMNQIGLPPKLCYPILKLGAKLFGGFDLEEYSAKAAMYRCKVPVIFFHGEADDFVPSRMSRENFDACVARKCLVTIPGAGHGLSYPGSPDVYLNALREFFGPEASMH